MIISISTKGLFAYNLFLIVHQCVQGKEGHLVRNLDLIVATSFEGLFDIGLKLLISWMSIEPDIKREVEEILLISLEWRLIVILAIIIAQSPQDWSVWHVLCEEGGNLIVSGL